MSTTRKDPPAAAADTDAATDKAPAPKLGEVFRTGPDTYGIVVGFETVKHTHDSDKIDDTEDEHPLVIDLPGTARRHELPAYTPPE